MKNKEIKVTIDRHSGDCDDCGGWDSVYVEVEILGETYHASEDNHLGGGTDSQFPVDIWEPEVYVKSFILDKLMELHGYNLTMEDNDYKE